MYPYGVYTNSFQRPVDHSWQALVRVITLSLTHNAHHPYTACRASKREGGANKGASQRSECLLPSIECSHLLPTHRRIHSSHHLMIIYHLTTKVSGVSAQLLHFSFLGSNSSKSEMSAQPTLDFMLQSLNSIFCMWCRVTASFAASSCGFASSNIP